MTHRLLQTDAVNHESVQNVTQNVENVAQNVTQNIENDTSTAPNR